MSTALLNNLIEYLIGTLSRSDMRWVADHLIEHLEQQESEQLKPYTMDEVNAMLDAAEAEIAAGKGIPHEESMRRWDEKIARMEAEEEA